MEGQRRSCPYGGGARRFTSRGAALLVAATVTVPHTRLKAPMEPDAAGHWLPRGGDRVEPGRALYETLGWKAYARRAACLYWPC
ncbi:hypothetical protein ACWDBF_02760 [Streptomyces angustmyceticus]